MKTREDYLAAYPDGPCHALGGLAHRCDGAPSWVAVSVDGGRWSHYRWCGAAVREAEALARQERQEQKIEEVYP